MNASIPPSPVPPARGKELRPRPTGEQLAAVQAGPHGAFLIAAGPGTGKTFTMVERFLWLVTERRVAPESILAVTFTDRAAAELGDRIAEALERLGRREALEALERAWIGTFHSLCSRLLQENSYLVGIAREIRVLDDVSQQLLIRRLQARLRSGAEGDIDLSALTALGPDEVSDLLRHGLQFVLKLKGRGISPDRFRKRALELHRGRGQGSDQLPAAAEEEAIGILHMVYDLYQRRLHRAGYHDFDDLILRATGALSSLPELRAQCRSRFRFLLVDEFQDTNRIQLDLIRQLAADDFANVTAVGDAKQSIYGWRDAEIENIRTIFPGRRLPLTRNRRSHQEILDCATALIRRDPAFADEPELVAERGSGGRDAVRIMMAPDAGTEARLVASEIRRLHRSGIPHARMAVLSYSIRRLPPEFENELRRQRIPYVTTGHGGLFDREEVKDLLAMLRLVEEPMDDAALVRVLCGPLVRMDDATLYPLALRRSGRRGMRLRDCFEEAVMEASVPPHPTSPARGEGPPLDPAVAGRGGALLATLDRLGEVRDALTISDVLNRLLDDTGYQRHCEVRAHREGPRALLNLRKVSSLASQFERDQVLASLGDFIEHLDQVFSAELPVGEADGPQADAVRLLTIHGAKGLEFDAAFLVNARPPLFRDSQRLFFDPDGMGFVMKYWRGEKHPRYESTTPSAPALKLSRDERRRAVYVALTRARDRLYVSAWRREGSPQEVQLEADDHFSEILTWALANPASATVVTGEQLGLPDLEEPPNADAHIDASVVALIERMRGLTTAAEASAAPGEASARLSFSQLHEFEVCPVRYQLGQVLRVPAPPDELLPRAARRGGGELGSSVHAALRAWHEGGVDDLLVSFGELAQLTGLEEQDIQEGRRMLGLYLAHPLASAPTLGMEVEFNLRLDHGASPGGGGQAGVLVRGMVDRICELEGRPTLVDYKTNRNLDSRLVATYRAQLRLYGLAAQHGLVPGGTGPRLLLFDLRRARAIEVEPDSDEVARRLRKTAAAIGAGNFSLGPEHADRPCFQCAYRPVCRHAL